MRISVLPMIMVLSGCASAYMRGATTASKPPASSAAKYTVTACTNVTNQQPIAMPDPLSYHLAEEPEGLVLYEFDVKGNGAKITNRWQQEDGSDVFFMWVGTSHGYQFVLAKDRTQGGVRMVHLAGTFKSYPENGVSKVSGTAQIICPMTGG